MAEAKELPQLMKKCFNTLGTNNSSEIATAVLAGFKLFFIPMATAKDKKATPEQKRYTMARDMITEGLALTTYLGVTKVIKDKCPAPICKNYYAKKIKLVEEGKIAGVSKNVLSAKESDMLKNVDTKALKEVCENFINPKKAVSAEAKTYVDKLDKIVGKLGKNWAEHSKVFTKTDGLKQKIFDAFDSKAKIVDPKNLFKDTKLNLSQFSVYALALVVIPAACNLIMPPIMRAISSKKDKGPQPQPAVTTVASVNTQKGKDVKFERNYYNNMPNLGNMRVG